VKDLVAYWIPSAGPIPERVVRIARRTLDRQGYVVRELNLKRWGAEIDTLLDLYNRCWERNWGFVPMTEAEFRHAAKALKLIVDPRLFLFVEKPVGTPVGFVGNVPDVNEILGDLDGRLFPWGLFKLLARRKRIRAARTMLLGVLPEYRGRGIDAALMVDVFERAAKAGYSGGEGSWILEDNVRMRTDLEALGGSVRATYRVYEMPV
jgi:GNAT superfamily N-acetyltransferase